MPCIRTSLLHLLIAATALAAPRPSLVVVVSVDQFSAELMERWCKTMPGGLGQLYRTGTTFVDAYHDHGFTETGPGHSVLLTGRSPMHTGIVENSWLNRETGKAQYCVEDPKAPLIGAKDSQNGASPNSLKGDTLGAWLLDQIPGSRVFAVTGKDRSAILMAGHRAQGVYWFSAELGFTSSTAYTHALPPWLTAFNTGFFARLDHESFFWSPLDPQGLPPGGSYQIHDKTYTMGLPRTILAVGMPRDRAFWDRFRGSPYLDEAIFGAAQALEEGEKLGQGPGVDLLALGLSATDYVGHDFGNSGPEMLDQLRRLDRELGQYLTHLRARVPNTWVILTADHGGSDFPERLQTQGLPAKRLMGGVWQRDFNQALVKRLGGTRAYFLTSSGSHQFYLDPVTVKASGKTREEILKAAVETAKATPEVAEACSALELERTLPDPKELPNQRSYKEKLRLSFMRERSGDLLVAFKPFYSMDDATHISAHGHPQDYDRRVPLIFQGPWKTETRTEPVCTVDLAPTLAKELGIHPQEALDGHPLELKSSSN